MNAQSEIPKVIELFFCCSLILESFFTSHETIAGQRLAELFTREVLKETGEAQETFTEPKEPQNTKLPIWKFGNNF